MIIDQPIRMSPFVSGSLLLLQGPVMFPGAGSARP